jgi:hypothetical protein
MSVKNRTDLHTLAKQMGNSAAMIERHFDSELTTTMAAEQLTKEKYEKQSPTQ